MTMIGRTGVQNSQGVLARYRGRLWASTVESSSFPHDTHTVERGMRCMRCMVCKVCRFYALYTLRLMCRPRGRLFAIPAEEHTDT